MTTEQKNQIMKNYPKTTGYWVYVHRTPDNMYYVGKSKRKPVYRWQQAAYQNSLKPYIEHYGWDNIEHIVVIDGLTEKQAAYWEERLINLYAELGCLINRYHSNHCSADIRNYKRNYYKQSDWKDYYVKYQRKTYHQRPEHKIYYRVKSYNQYHPNNIVETPLEAKKKYLGYGYIPDYIKSDDLA